MVELTEMLISGLCKVIFAGLGIVLMNTLIPWIKDVIIPLLKDYHLYELCHKFVLAAEKMAESGALDKSAKKQFVINCLKSKGVIVTDAVDAYIECAVEELDLAVESGIVYLDSIFDAVPLDEAELQVEEIEE